MSLVTHLKFWAADYMVNIDGQTQTVSHERYVTEDMANIPFGVMLKLIRSQLFFPLALIAAIAIKLVTKVKGRSDALNAVSLDTETIEMDQLPALARTAFDGVKYQLPDFHWVTVQRRPCLGLRQQYEALALHQDGRTVALCEWQHQMVVVRAVKGEDPVKSTEAITTELVSFTTDSQYVTTCHVPEEHMAAFALYDDGLGEVEAVSNQERLEHVVEKHVSRIEKLAVNVMNDIGAMQQAQRRSDKVLQHFMKLGLIRKLLPQEVPALQKSRQKHASDFDPYTRV